MSPAGLIPKAVVEVAIPPGQPAQGTSIAVKINDWAALLGVNNTPNRTEAISSFNFGDFILSSPSLRANLWKIAIDGTNFFDRLVHPAGHTPTNGDACWFLGNDFQHPIEE
jgi:hypothetical protein